MGNLLSEPTIYPPVRGFGLGFLCLTEADAHFFLPLYGGGGIIPSSIFRAHALKLWRIASLGRFNAHKMLGHSPCVARRICGFSSTRRHLESRSPVNHGRYFQTFKEPRNWFQGVDSASLCSLAVRYDNPITTRFLAPIDCSKIPAQNRTYSSPLGPTWANNSRQRNLKNYTYMIHTYILKFKAGIHSIDPLLGKKEQPDNESIIQYKKNCSRWGSNSQPRHISVLSISTVR